MRLADGVANDLEMGEKTWGIFKLRVCLCLYPRVSVLLLDVLLPWLPMFVCDFKNFNENDNFDIMLIF